MKKVLLVVALLLFATTVFATDVEITATKVGALNTAEPNAIQKVAIGFKGLADDNAIAAFALILTTDSGCNIDHIADFNKGESKSHGGGYGIFPGKFRDLITVQNGTDVCTPQGPGYSDGNYNPLAPAADPCAANTGNDNPKMIVELGALYVEPNKPALNGQGTLFTVDVNLENQGASGECNLCVALEPTRGGVVKLQGATAASVTWPAGAPPHVPVGCINVKYTVAVTNPVLIGDVNMQNLLLGKAAGKTVTIQIYNGATLVETLTPTMTAGTAGNGHYNVACAVAGPGTYTIKYKVSHWLKKQITGVVLVAGSNSIATPSLLNGDCDGSNTVNSTDLGQLKGNYLKTGVGLAGDLDENGTVNSSDLGILKSNYLKSGD